MDKFRKEMENVCNASGGLLSNRAAAVMDILLKDGTKRRIVRSGLSDREIAGIISGSVREIEEGVLETVDDLVRKNILKRRRLFEVCQ